jgi:anion-transporting  ArsA/GET3 family ATPase
MTKKETKKIEEKVESKVESLEVKPEEVKGVSEENIAEELVSLSKEQLQELIDSVSALKKENEDIKKTSNILLQIADKRALSNYESRNKGEIQYDIKVRAMEVNGEEKIIVAWKTLKDRVYKDSDLRWKEEQTIKLYFLDGTTKDISLYDFNQRFSYVVCKKTGEMIDSVSGEIVLKLLRNDNGEEIEISTPYVN